MKGTLAIAVALTLVGCGAKQKGDDVVFVSDEAANVVHVVDGASGAVDVTGATTVTATGSLVSADSRRNVGQNLVTIDGSSIAGSASEAIIISRLAPMPPKPVPTSMPASARKNRALPKRAMSAIRSAVQENNRPLRKVGTREAATHVAANMR